MSIKVVALSASLESGVVRRKTEGKDEHQRRVRALLGEVTETR